MAKKQTKKTIPKPVAQSQVKASMPQPADRKGLSVNLKMALLLGFISCLVYANTFKNGFVYDDCTVITDNTIVHKGVSAIPEILSTPYRRGYFITANDLYRPLSLVTFAIEYQFFDKNSTPYHIINILLFASCVILLFQFLEELFDRKKTAVAFVAALLFAVHPIHTEVVANIKSRDELLCFFFAFLCLNIFFKYIQSGKMLQLLMGAFCFFLSFLAKETVVTFLGIIPLVFFFYRNEHKPRSVYITISVVIATGIFLYIRYSVLNFYGANETANLRLIDNALAAKDLSIDSRMATAILILGLYIKLLFVPYPLISDYSYNHIQFVSFSNPVVLISLATYIFLAVSSLLRFIKNHKDPYAFGILFFLMTMSLFSNILFLIGTMMGERLLFLPSVGFCLVIALVVEKVAGNITEINFAAANNRKALGIVAPIAIIFIVLTFQRNEDWLSNYSLFSADVKNAPRCCKLNFNLGSDIINNIANKEQDPQKKKMMTAEGIGYLNKAIAIYPDYELAHRNLCDVYFHNGMIDSAEVHGKKAFSLNPNIASTLNDLGGVYFIKKDYVKSIAMCINEIKLAPGNVHPYANIGLSYLNLGKFDSAIYYSNKAISIDPTLNLSYENNAYAYRATNRIDSAKKYETIAQKNNPGFKL